MTTTSTTKPPRQTKTPAQRAQDVVDVLDRRLKKLRGKKADLSKEATVVDREIGDVEKRLAYAKQNPDLPQQPATPTATTTGATT